MCKESGVRSQESGGGDVAHLLVVLAARSIRGWRNPAEKPAKSRIVCRSIFSWLLIPDSWLLSRAEARFR